MCGNFGLLFIKNTASSDTSTAKAEEPKIVSPFAYQPGVAVESSADALPLSSEDRQFRQRRVSFSIDVRDDDDSNSRTDSVHSMVVKDPLRNPLHILESQASNTEIRGGQAGGYSSLEYEKLKNTSPMAMHPVGEEVNSPHQSSHHSVGSSQHSSRIVAGAKRRLSGALTAASTKAANINIVLADEHSPIHSSSHEYSQIGGSNNGHSSITSSSDQVFRTHKHNNTTSSTTSLAAFEAEFLSVPHNTRVRTVARKRHPLAADLTEQFVKARRGKGMQLDNTFTGE